MAHMEEKLAILRKWIGETVPPHLGVIIPVSGGTDSALTFWLYNQVLPERTVGVFFGSNLRSQEWFESIGKIRYVTPPLSEYDPKTTRWLHVLHSALSESRILIGTRNKTENYLGAYSNASRLAFHLPLIGTWKTTILELCAHVGVPEEVIRSSREADPVCGRPEALAQIPFSAVDAFLSQKISGLSGPLALDQDQHAYLEDLYRRNSFKQEFPVEGPTLV
jgi:NH3-dependent NAD+ synthetase